MPPMAFVSPFQSPYTSPFPSEGAVAAWTPASKSGGQIWVDFGLASGLWEDTARTDQVDADADYIKGVTDKSGSARHLSQGTTTRAATWYQNQVNGLSIGRFDGADDYYPAFTAMSLTDFTLAMVVKPASAAGLQAGFYGSTAGGFFIFNNAIYNRGVSIISQAGVWSVGVPFTLVVTRASNSINVYINGVDKTKVGGVTDSSTWDIASVFSRPDSGNVTNGDACEAVAWDSAPVDATELANLHNYLKRWGTIA